jgi:hypothetical protein
LGNPTIPHLSAMVILFLCGAQKYIAQASIGFHSFSTNPSFLRVAAVILTRFSI